jgi:hypothetical protein
MSMANGTDRAVIIRDLIIFQIKLLLDGVKDVVVSPVAIGAAALDVIFPTARRGYRFYAVIRVAESFDRWLNLYGASRHADENEEGLFGESAAGSDSLLGRIEEIVVGRREEGGEQTKRTASM